MKRWLTTASIVVTSLSCRGETVAPPVDERTSPAPPTTASIEPETSNHLVTTTPSSPEPLLKEVILFDARRSEEYFSFRIPALLAFKSERSDSSVVLAFAEGRRACGRDAGDIDIVLRKSTDGGASFRDLITIAGADGLPETDSGTWGNPTVLRDAQNGTIWLLVNYQASGKAQFPCRHWCGGPDATCRDQGLESRIEPGDRRVFVMKSTDEGESWSPPKDLTSQVQPPSMAWDAVGPGNGIQLRTSRCGRGKLLFPAIGRNISSDDGGLTWSMTPALPGGTSEGTLVELTDGRLLRNDRPVHPSLVQAARRPLSVSDDCGKTWSPWSPQAGLPSTRVHASTIRLERDAIDLLVFSNPASLLARREMTLRISDDGGRTWRASRVVDPNTAGYSSLAELPDGRIGLLYEKGRNQARDPGRIAFATIDPLWLASAR